MINTLLKLAMYYLNKIAYIKKKPDGYYVFSEKGKPLGGPYRSYKQALKRLRQVEYFKRFR